MAWKPKERELTPEEAIAQAKATVAPLWFNSSPLLIALKKNKQTSVYPLDATFKNKQLLIVFCDLFDPTIETVLYLLKEWLMRYHSFDFTAMVVFQPKYKMTQKREVVEATLERFRVNYPVCIDVDGMIGKAMGIKRNPSVVLFCDGRVRQIQDDLQKIEPFELELQDFLRKEDPGLALLRPFSPKESLCSSSETIVFSDRESAERKLKFTGEWKKEDEGLTTTDSSASIAFDCHTHSLSLVASSPTKTVDVAKILVEVEEAPVFDTFAGTDLKFDDSGLSYLGVRSCHLYHVLKNLPEKERSIVLSFPNADKTPVTILGLIFHN